MALARKRGSIMKKYIGVKLIEAEPMTYGKFADKKYGESRMKTDFSIENEFKDGYMVTYTDGYVSWSPKEVFEKAYLPLTDPEGKALRQQDIDNFIGEIDAIQYGDKTTVVHAKLKNGFILSETSSCVEPVNFNMDIGKDICVERIKNKTWNNLGFLLQCARGGMK